MSDWKSIEWQKKLKSKSPRYWIRDEIEEIVKEENIDRICFYEYSKFEYKDIVTKFYYSFVDYKNYSDVTIQYCWLHFRKDLKIKTIINEQDKGWVEFLNNVKNSIPITNDNKFYLILSEGWVYEGCADEIFNVLSETDGLLEDFYFVSRKFDWFISYCSDGECAAIYSK